MSWTTPKTNWHDGEAFLLQPDYARIRANLLALHAQALPLYPGAAAPNLENPAQNDWARCSFFTAVEQSCAALIETTVPENAYTPRTFAGNDRVWTAADLNRIEGAALRLHNQLQGQKDAQPRLAFILKGSEF